MTFDSPARATASKVAGRSPQGLRTPPLPGHSCSAGQGGSVRRGCWRIAEGLLLLGALHTRGASFVEALGPIDLSTEATVSQSSDFSASFPAQNAIDGNPGTFSHTLANTDEYWWVALNQSRVIHAIEIVNRADAGLGIRLGGLVVRVMDDQSNTVAVSTISNPGDGATWSFTLPGSMTGRYVRVGLENGATNDGGNRYVTLGEFNILCSPNLAATGFPTAVRYQDSLAPATHVNDGNHATEFKSTSHSVDAYWEVDLDRPHAISSVRIWPASGFAQNLSHATVTLFDGDHDRVFAFHLDGQHLRHDVPVPGLRHARFIRVGFENKERSHPTGGIGWHLGLKEVQVFGVPSEDVGILGFAASDTAITNGQPVHLSWDIECVDSLTLYPLGTADAMSLTDSSGQGGLTVAPTQSVEYVLVAQAEHGTYTRAVTITVDAQPLGPRISEFVANNRLSLRDGRGRAPDWIELYNPNNTVLDMGGYGLSDRLDQPMKWVFPSTNVPPHGHVIVFASDRNTPVDDEGQLHADFRLDADLDSVVLTAPDGTTRVDAITNFPPQMQDLAYARDLSQAFAFTEPTPRAHNHAATYLGWLHPPVLSHARGYYTNAFTLVISNQNAGASLLYSVDGTEPGLAFSNALPVSATLCVRAAVSRAGYKSPWSQTHTYLYVDDVLTSGVMNQSTVNAFPVRARQGLIELPSISVAVPDIANDGLSSDYVEREASVEILWPDGVADVQSNCGFFRFGGAWTLFTKKNYRLKFRPEYGNRKLESPLFDGYDHGFKAETAFDQLDLRGGGHDMSQRGFYMSARFAEDTMLDMGSINPHGRFVNLYLNGTYWGQYHCRERLVDRFLADYLGGPAEDYVSVRGNDNVGSTFIPGTPAPPQYEPWHTVLDNRDDYAVVAPYVDMSHLIDFMLLWTYGNSESEYRAAGSTIATPLGGFKFWIADADGFLRTVGDRTANAGPANLFGELASEAHPDFMTLLADRIYKHFFNDGALTQAQCEQRLNRRMDEIYNSMVAECARWGVRTPANWESAAQGARDNIFPSRASQMVTYLRNRGYYPNLEPPTFNQRGGSVPNGFEVTLSSGSGTIYYTLDGSDPRLPGGGISPTARIFVPPVVTTQAFVVAGAEWRYWDQGAVPATNWTHTSYVDTHWPAGNAELGAGDGAEVTALAFDGAETCYFRKTFSLTNKSGINQLLTELRRDDGAAVYLNGERLFRDNMPSGNLTFTSPATSRVAGADEITLFPHTSPATALVTGTNVVAVEVHQVSGGSTDISFDLALSGLQFSGSLLITNSTVVRTRVWTGSAWSPIDETRFLMAERRPVAEGDLLITEVHYAPRDSDDYEFIEIQNVSTSLVDLTGAVLSDGVDFEFPEAFTMDPGELVVIIEDALPFSKRYEAPASTFFFGGIRVAGQWSGALADEGERIAIATSNGTGIVAVRYRNDRDWPERARSRGSSLELIRPASVPADMAQRAVYLDNGVHWQSSSLLHGSPGRLDDFVRSLRISEVLGHTDAEIDWVELHNRGTETIDASGLFLGDHHDQPLRYMLPTGSTIEANGYLSLGATELGFAFSELGSDILLVQADGTNLVRFFDTVDFPAVEREETFGLYRKSDGDEDFTELRSGTRDTTNALPRVGPVVFSEIMIHPVSGRVEYVEITSIADQAVPLYHPVSVTNTWALSGAVSYAFPTGLVLNPCEALIVCATNPARFQAAHALDPSVRVFGPWKGALDNDGESIKLRRPGNPEPDGFVPYYRVDRVNYRPHAPWPTNSVAGGVSLERMPLEGYGNDPICWQTSPAGGTPGIPNGNRLPFVNLNGDGSVDEGQTATVRVDVVDFDVPWQSVSVSTGRVPAAATFDPFSGAFQWTTGEADGPGDHLVEFIGIDTACRPGMTTQALMITVREINLPPVLPPLPGALYPSGLELGYTFTASDPDLPTQTLTYAATGLPEGLSINTASGDVTGVGAVTGTYAVAIIVHDDQHFALYSTNVWQLTLSEPFAASAELSPGHGLVLSFAALTGNTYRTEYRDTLTTGAWHTLEIVGPVTNTAVFVNDPDVTGPTQRFYRVQWIP